ncbi:MAG: PAS domain S-box protein [Gemmatimonadetes bacterium]|nr:PAS domain S-box protein [Gemmatimonadota bacterium]
MIPTSSPDPPDARAEVLAREQAARAEAEAARERLTNILESIRDGFVALDRGWRFTYVNRKAEELLGRPRAELVGRVVWEEFPQSVGSRFYQEYHRALAEQRPVDFEAPSLLVDRIFEVHAYPAGDGLSVYFRDITERRRAEEALRESEARLRQSEAALRESAVRYRGLFEQSRDAIYITARDGHFVDVNQAALDLFGYTREEILRLNARELYADPADRRRFQRAIEKKGAVLDFEVQLRRKDGGLIHCELSSSVERAADGSVVGYRGIIHDITRRKRMQEALRQSEEHFRSLIEHALDIITILDAEGTIRYESPSVQRVLGYRPDEMLGRDVFSFVHPEDVAATREAFARVLSGRYGGEALELRFRHKDESWRVIEATANNLLAHPAVRGVVINSSDITERKQAEEALRQREAQLRQAHKMEAVGRLAGGVAHDFNNLLTAIQGHAQLLIEDLAPDNPMAADLQEIKNAADRAASLTRQLLAFSRKQLLQPRPLDLNATVSELEKMLRRLIGEDIQMQVRLAPQLGRVRADLGQVEQVIVNLVVNARDAMPDGGRITIETANAELAREQAHRPEMQPGRYVMLAVTDTGHGMDRHTQSQIFEPFFTTKEHGRGSGLGLATVYGIVKQSGGYIWVYSEVDSGTTFKVYLPRIDEPAAVIERAPRAAAPGGSETILLAEDDEAVRRLARRILERRGYAVLEAASGPQALQVAEQHTGRIYLLITDVVMPEMSGRELARRLAARDPEIRVLYMSGYTDDAIVRHGVLEAGIAFLQKPFTPELLAQTTRQVLDAPAVPAGQ